MLVELEHKQDVVDVEEALVQVDAVDLVVHLVLDLLEAVVLLVEWADVVVQQHVHVVVQLVLDQTECVDVIIFQRIGVDLKCLDVVDLICVVHLIFVCVQVQTDVGLDVADHLEEVVDNNAVDQLLAQEDVVDQLCVILCNVGVEVQDVVRAQPFVALEDVLDNVVVHMEEAV
jgi:hypothetical protein